MQKYKENRKSPNLWNIKIRKQNEMSDVLTLYKKRNEEYNPLNFHFSTLHKIGLPSDGSFGQSPQKGLILESNARKLLYGS